MNFISIGKRKKQSIATPSFVVVLVLVSSALFIHVFSPLILSRLAHTAARPFWRAEQAAVGRASDIAALFTFKQALIEENKKLKKELVDMRLHTYARRLFFEENKRLKELLGRSAKEETILATVLARPNTSLYDTLVIDVGEEHDIRGGDLVLVSDNIVIGSVNGVFQNTSLVTFFSTPGVEVSVAIGPEQITTVAIGQGGGTFVARLPRDVGIAEGDTIVMPGINPKFFGIVEEIVADPTEPFQTILFKNPVNVAEIKWVQILRTNGEQQTISNEN